MTKRITYFAIAIISLLIISYSLNNYIIQSNRIPLSYSLISVYLFHSIAALIVYILIEIVAENVPDQAGYGYLAGIAIKLGLFVLIFQTDVFANENLTKPERLSLVVPLFLFLTTEAFAIFRVLNSK